MFMNLETNSIKKRTRLDSVALSLPPALCISLSLSLFTEVETDVKNSTLWSTGFGMAWKKF